jgi:hypothetical protein
MSARLPVVPQVSPIPAHRPVSPGVVARTRAAGLLAHSALAALAALAACRNDDDFSGTFDAPTAAAVLPADLGPFTRPIAFVADRHGGRVRLLDVEAGRYLADDVASAYFRGSSLAAGSDRVLVGVAATATATTTAAWVLDQRFNQLVRLAHVVSVDARGAPVEAVPDIAVDGALDASQVAVAAGPAATETWTLRHASGRWEISGSRSGPQAPGVAGQTWSSRGGALRVSLPLEAAEGANATVRVDSGAVELDLPGAPVDVAAAAIAGGPLAVAWEDPEAATGAVALIDPAAQEAFAAGAPALPAPLALPAGARPARLSWSADGSVLAIADRGLPALHLAAADGTVTTIALPWPITEAALIAGAQRTASAPLPPDRAVVAPVPPASGEHALYVVDLSSGAVLDSNAGQPGVQGLQFDVPVRGLVPLPVAFTAPKPDDDGEFVQVAGVAASLLDGRVVFVDPARACLVPDRLGPRTTLIDRLAGFGDYRATFDASPPRTASLLAVEDPTRHVTVNGCAGVARSENWSLRFDALRDGWVAEGGQSGIQATVAREDARWWSDDGGISLVVRSGLDPSQEGHAFTFTVRDGVHAATGDDDGDGAREINLDLPGRPAAFVMTVDGEVVPRVVVPAENADIVVRIDPETAISEVVFD